MTRLLAVVAGLALLGGCARQWAYDRPGVTEAERARDAEECERSNEVPRVSRPFVFAGGRLVSYPFEGWTATATISACRGGLHRQRELTFSSAGRLDRLEVEGRRQEGLRVGMGRLREDPLTRPVLDDAAGPHDQDLVAERPDHAEVVADEHIGEPMARLELAQQVDELCLHRDVEGGGRFVEDEQARLEHEGPSDRDPLPLAAENSCG